MTSVPSRKTWVVWPAGRKSPCSGSSAAATENSSFVPKAASAGRYLKDHWNWPATARTLTFGVELVASTAFSVDQDTKNRKMTMTVGTRVHVISARLLPWVWGGSSSSPGLRQ